MTRTLLRVGLVVTLSATFLVFALPQEYAVEQKEQPMPYEFEYRTDDGEGTKQGRQETADGSGAVKGWYGYNDPNGIYRRVDYVADQFGFRAHINTNEPGTKSEDPADVQVKSSAPVTTHQAAGTHQIHVGSHSPY